MKIFFIGFNKTGTTTYFYKFKDIMKSIHSKQWCTVSRKTNINKILKYFSKYNCYSDGERANFNILDRHLPKSKFILNTRGLHQWILSRIKHIYRYHPRKSSGNMTKEWYKTKNKEDIIVNWIKRRNNYHRNAIKYFSNKDNFLILDINDPILNNKLQNFVGFNLNTDIKKNTREQIKYKNIDYWNKIIFNAFNKLNIKKEDYNNLTYINYI